MSEKELDKNKMEIEISRYKNLVDALGKPVFVARMVLLSMVIVALLVVGIFAIVGSLKVLYPYKSINSNAYGATIIQDEDTEIIYWLFSTADLWANSGIEVKEGDVISIRTSGAFNTAIHHLVADANNNTKLRDPWILSKGGDPLRDSPLYKRDSARNKYCIAPNLPMNTILMQVVPNDIATNKDDLNWRTDSTRGCFVDGHPDTAYNKILFKESGLKALALKPDIYEIGMSKENIRIRTNGTLHFAVNDIALTKRMINAMLKDDEVSCEESFFHTTDKFDSLFTKKGLKVLMEEANMRGDSIGLEKWNRQKFIEMKLIDSDGHPIAEYWDVETRQYKSLLKGKKILDASIWDTSYLAQKGIIRNVTSRNELKYYRDEEFVDAWFVDNIGSFMIVIERKRIR